MDLGNLCGIYIDGSMPELVVEPFKCKRLMKIIIPELSNIARNMKRFPWSGIKAYVKMNFQISYEAVREFIGIF